jgi:hypothetical protein
MVLKEGRRWACLPWERELQQVESTAMQDLRRADATAVCRGNSVSSPATADLELQEPRCKGKHTDPRPSIHQSAGPPSGNVPAEEMGGSCRGGRQQGRAEAAAGEGRRAEGCSRGGGGGAAQRCHFFLLLGTCCDEGVKP